MEGSFCSSVKNTVEQIVPRSGCCRRTDKMLKAAIGSDDFEAAVDTADRFLCEDCAAVWLRRCFILYGAVTDPEKSYHLELSFPDEKLRDKAISVAESLELFPKRGTRRSRYTMYFKSSEAIGDFLARIGAVAAVFELLNHKLVKEAMIGINRQNNFEAANLKKTVVANITYINVVNYLTDSGNFDSLPDDLKETAKLRIENDTASLAELGRLHSPSISKSGVKHRLDRISEIAESIRNRNKKH